MDPLFEVGESSEPGEVIVPVTNFITEVPTAGEVRVVKVPKECDAQSFRRALSGAYQVYLQVGRLEPSLITNISGVPEAVVTYLLTTEEFSYALSCRGVDTKGWGHLTSQQDAALMILTDIGGTKTWAQKLKEAGITQAIFTAWLKNPTFNRRWQTLSEDIVNNHNTALVQLGQKAGEGDMRAIELQLAVAGRYSANQQAAVDIMAFMNRIQEILSRHLVDQPEILRGIAQDMRQESERLSINQARTVVSDGLSF